MNFQECFFRSEYLWLSVPKDGASPEHCWASFFFSMVRGFRARLAPFRLLSLRTSLLRRKAQESCYLFEKTAHILWNRRLLEARSCDKVIVWKPKSLSTPRTRALCFLCGIYPTFEPAPPTDQHSAPSAVVPSVEE